jgi:hypothetical protein
MMDAENSATKVRRRSPGTVGIVEMEVALESMAAI